MPSQTTPPNPTQPTLPSLAAPTITVRRILTTIYAQCRFAIVFISNQAGAPKQQNAFKRKLPLLGKKLDVPFHALAALSYDEVRSHARLQMQDIW